MFRYGVRSGSVIHGIVEWATLYSPQPGPTAIELRSADFSPPRSGPAQTAGSGLKSALLSCRNSLNSMAVLPLPLPTRASRGEGENFWWLSQGAPDTT